MKKRTWQYLWGILAVLVVYVLVVEKPFVSDIRGPARRKEMLFPKFDPAQATAIEITAQGRTTRLERDGATWVLADGRYEADQKAVNDMLARVDTLATGQIVSENKEKQGALGVDTTGVDVKISGGSGVLANFRIGRSTPDYSGLFIRLEGSNDVYGIAGITRYMFDRGAQTWRDRKIVPLSPDIVSRLMIAWADTMVTYLKQGTDSLDASSWKVEGNRPDQPAAAAIADAVKPLIRAAAGLTADGFPAATDTIPTNWDQPALRLDVEAQGGDRVTIEFGPKNSRGQHYVRRLGRGGPGKAPEIYLVGDWRLKTFKKAYRDMLAPKAG